MINLRLKFIYNRFHHVPMPSSLCCNALRFLPNHPYDIVCSSTQPGTQKTETVFSLIVSI